MNAMLFSEWLIGFFLLASALGVILAHKPVYAALSFLFSLMMLAALFLELNAPLIALLQILVYAGAILVVFIFVMILFQDAYKEIQAAKSNSFVFLLIAAVSALIAAFAALCDRLLGFGVPEKLSFEYGTPRSLGKVLYIEFFFPFEAVIILFLIALVGGFYLARKGE